MIIACSFIELCYIYTMFDNNDIVLDNENRRKIRNMTTKTGIFLLNHVIKTKKFMHVAISIISNEININDM